MKLVLFDLDGTLIAFRKPVKHESPGDENKWTHAIRTVFHKNADINFDYDGRLDKQILWMATEPLGISKKEFNEKLPLLQHAMYAYYVRHGKNKKPYAIDGAQRLISFIKQRDDIVFGLLTGNITEIALWKLRTCGYDGQFTFGLFGEEADDRIALAQSVFQQANEYFHREFSPQNVVVIGDTLHDIRCGKAIGAYTIGVTQKGKDQQDILEKEGADLVVDSLMDQKVLDFLKVNPV